MDRGRAGRLKNNSTAQSSCVAQCALHPGTCAAAALWRGMVLFCWPEKKAFLCGQKVGTKDRWGNDNYAGPCGFYGCLRIFVGSLEDFEKSKTDDDCHNFWHFILWLGVAFPVTTALILVYVVLHPTEGILVAPFQIAYYIVVWAIIAPCGHCLRKSRARAEDAARASKARPPRYWTAAALALHLRANGVDDRTVARFSRTTGAAFLAACDGDDAEADAVGAFMDARGVPPGFRERQAVRAALDQVLALHRAHCKTLADRKGLPVDRWTAHQLLQQVREELGFLDARTASKIATAFERAGVTGADLAAAGPEAVLRDVGLNSIKSDELHQVADACREWLGQAPRYGAALHRARVRASRRTASRSDAADAEVPVSGNPAHGPLPVGAAVELMGLANGTFNGRRGIVAETPPDVRQAGRIAVIYVIVDGQTIALRRENLVLLPARPNTPPVVSGVLSPDAPPEYWDEVSDPSVAERVTVRTGSDEYRRVSTAFLLTLDRSQFTIHSIERVQNMELWRTYAAKRESICEREDAADAARNYVRNWLFHGCPSDVVPKILQQGFNRSFCGANATLYGKGVYFARDASFSTYPLYCKPDAEGVQTCFLVRAAVGEWCKAKRDDITPGVRDEAKNILYDSTVDNLQNLSIFVLYHDAQTYPEYIVRFSQTWDPGNPRPHPKPGLPAHPNYRPNMLLDPADQL